MAKNENFEKEKLKVTLSFGMIAIYLGLFKIVSDFIDKTGFLKYFKYLFYGCFSLTVFFLVLYIISTAARYKNREAGFIDEYFYVSNGTRKFFYDEAINLLGIGLLMVLFMFLIHTISRYSGESWIGWVVGSLIYFLVIFLLGRRVDKIRRTRISNKKLAKAKVGELIEKE